MRTFCTSAFVLLALACASQVPNAGAVDTTLCKDLVFYVDDFTNERNWSTPFGGPMVFEKTKGPNGTAYYLFLKKQYAGVYSGSGVTLLLQGGGKIIKPSAEVTIDVDANAEYVATAMLTLSQADLAKLSSAAITDFRLYIYDSSVEGGETYVEWVKCLRKAK